VCRLGRRDPGPNNPTGLVDPLGLDPPGRPNGPPRPGTQWIYIDGEGWAELTPSQIIQTSFQSASEELTIPSRPPGVSWSQHLDNLAAQNPLPIPPTRPLPAGEWENSQHDAVLTRPGQGPYFHPPVFAQGQMMDLIAEDFVLTFAPGAGAMNTVRIRLPRVQRTGNGIINWLGPRATITRDNVRTFTVMSEDRLRMFQIHTVEGQAHAHFRIRPSLNDPFTDAIPGRHRIQIRCE